MNANKNSDTNTAAQARKKRKQILRERNVDKYKQICSSIQRTTLSYVTQYKGSSSNNDTKFTQHKLTQPSSIAMLYNGQSLINRFDSVNFNQPRLNPLYNNTYPIQTKKMHKLDMQSYKVQVKRVATTMATLKLVTLLQK